MSECKDEVKVEKEKTKQYYFSKDLYCKEIQDEMLWRDARLRELYATGKTRY